MFCTYCGAKVPDTLQPCPSCGRKSPLAPTGAVSRDGKVLYIPAGAELPDFCLRCNAPAEGYRKKVKLSWHPPALLLLIFLGLLPYAIVALIMTKKARVQVPLCAKHRASWTMLATVGLLLLLAAIGVFIALAVMDSHRTGAGKGILDQALGSGACLLFPLAGVGGIVLLFLGIRRVSPQKIDEFGNAWIKGVSPAFLDQHVGPDLIR